MIRLAGMLCLGLVLNHISHHSSAGLERIFSQSGLMLRILTYCL